MMGGGALVMSGDAATSPSTESETTEARDAANSTSQAVAHWASGGGEFAAKINARSRAAKYHLADF